MPADLPHNKPISPTDSRAIGAGWARSRAGGACQSSRFECPAADPSMSSPSASRSTVTVSSVPDDGASSLHHGAWISDLLHTTRRCDALARSRSRRRSSVVGTSRGRRLRLSIMGSAAASAAAGLGCGLRPTILSSGLLRPNGVRAAGACLRRSAELTGGTALSGRERCRGDARERVPFS